MIADTSEEAVWSLSDALLGRDAAGALRIGERLIYQGENVTGLIYGLASRLRSACAAAGQLEEGVPPKQVESSLKMHPYAAKLLVGRLRDADVADLRMATEALAELELWCRGGADYGDELASDPRAQASGGRCGRGLTTTATRQPCGRLSTSCARRCSCAWRLFARPCRSSRRACAASSAIVAASPPSIARLEAAEVGLHRAGEQAVLSALALAA